MADGTSMSRPASDTPVAGPEAPTRLDQVREARRASPETEPAKPEAAPPVSPERIAAKPPRRRLLRPLLFALLPVALAGAAYIYVTGGQVMATDNAYVEAD